MPQEVASVEVTLNLSVVAGGAALQVGDRLLTRAVVRVHDSKVQGFRPHDFYANKNLVFAPSYGLVSLGYTGGAYLEGVPTDEWIARRLWLDDLGPGATRIRKWQGKWPSLGEAVDTLRRELNRVFNAKGGELAVGIAGWQWTRRSPRLRGIAWTLSNIRASEFRVDRQPRFWAAARTMAVGSHPLLPPREYRQLREAVASAASLDEVEHILTAKIAEVAARPITTVGPDAMVIRIVPSQVPQVRIRFQQAAPPRALIQYQGRDNSVAYAPWVVMRDLLWRPCAMVGPKIEMSSDGIEVEVVGDDGNYGGLWPQRRTSEGGPPGPPLQWPYPGMIMPPPPDAEQS